MSGKKKSDSLPTIGKASPPGHTRLREDRDERELDEALMGTFPASDPVSVEISPPEEKGRRQG